MCAGKPYAVLRALLAAKLREQNVCAVPFLVQHGRGQGGLLGVRASGPASSAAAVLEGVVAELKAIAAKPPTGPETDILKRKVTDVVNPILWDF